MLTPRERAEACSWIPTSEPWMPTSPSNSIALSEPYGSNVPPNGPVALPPVKWRRSALLFVLTVVSILYTAALIDAAPAEPVRRVNGVAFAVSLLAILLPHELAHSAFPRHHRVN